MDAGECRVLPPLIEECVYMKLLHGLSIALLLLCLPAISSAQTYLFGFEARVGYLDGSSVHIVAFGLAECESRYQDALAAGNVDSGATYSCRPRPIDIARLAPQFDWKLGCIVCPLLDDRTAKLVYPARFPEVIELKRKYRIDDYIADLKAIEQAYDLEGFHRRMSELEQSIMKQ
jgi:hypothetical protein